MVKSGENTLQTKLIDIRAPTESTIYKGEMEEKATAKTEKEKEKEKVTIYKTIKNEIINEIISTMLNLLDCCLFLLAFFLHD